MNAVNLVVVLPGGKLGSRAAQYMLRVAVGGINLIPDPVHHAEDTVLGAAIRDRVIWTRCRMNGMSEILVRDANICRSLHNLVY